MEGRASSPAAWPAPFTLTPETKAEFIALGDGHFVRAQAGASPQLLLSASERMPA
jgi:peptide/nickel transport system ATP-binding protein